MLNVEVKYTKGEKKNGIKNHQKNKLRIKDYSDIWCDNQKHEFYSCKLILFQTVGYLWYYEIKIKPKINKSLKTYV